MEVAGRQGLDESASEPESGSSGGGGAQAQLGVAAESRPVSEDRRGRGGGSSWVRSVGRASGGRGDRPGRGQLLLPWLFICREIPPPGSVLCTRGVRTEPSLAFPPHPAFPHLGWVGGTGRRLPGSQAAAGSPRGLTLLGSLVTSVWVLELRHLRNPRMGGVCCSLSLLLSARPP